LRARPGRRDLEAVKTRWSRSSSRRRGRSAQRRRQARKDGHTILFAQNSALTFRASRRNRSPTMPPGPRATRHHLTHADHPRRAQRRTVRNFAEYRILEEEPGQVRIGHPGSAQSGILCAIDQRTHGYGARAGSYSGAAPANRRIAREHMKASLSLGALSAHIKSGVFRASSLRAVSRVCRHTPMRELAIKMNCSASGSAFSRLQDPRRREESLVSAIEQAPKHPLSRQDWRPRHLAELRHRRDAAEIRAEFKRVGEMAGRPVD